MDEDQIGAARNKLRLAAALVVFGVFMGLRHFFLVQQGPQDGIPLWFWLTLCLSVGMLVGAVESDHGLLEVYGVLIGAASSLLGAVLWLPIVAYMFFKLKLWEDGQRSFDALVARGPILMFGGFALGALLTGNVVYSYWQEYLEQTRAGRAEEADED